MAIELAENCNSNTEVQLQVSVSMADLFVEALFYSNKHCTVFVTYTDSDGSTKVAASEHRDSEVKAVEAALRIASCNFEGTGSEDDYKLAESIMPTDPAARWIP